MLGRVVPQVRVRSLDVPSHDILPMMPCVLKADTSRDPWRFGPSTLRRIFHLVSLMPMDAVKIIIGVAASAAVFYVTSSMLLAQKQLVAATRLFGYLSYWQNWILEHDFFGVYHEGVKWNEEDREIRKRGGGPKEGVELAKSKKQGFLVQLKERIEKADFEAENAEVVRNFQRTPKE